MDSRIAQLHALLATRFPGAVQNTFLETIAPCRQTTATLLEGKLVEIVSASGCDGAGLLLLRFCEAATGTLALVDGADAFDPATLTQKTRQRLLWVRCRRATEAIRAADLLLRDGNLSTVLLDLRLLPVRELQRLPSSVWHRLRMLAERTNVAVGVFSPCRTVACAARRWEVDAALALEALQEPAQTLTARLQSQVHERLSPFSSSADSLAIAS